MVYRNTAQIDNIKMPVKKILCLYARLISIIKYMERIVILLFGIDTVTGKTAAKTI